MRDLADRRREDRGDARVDRVAALAEHADARFDRVVAARRDDAVRAEDLGPHRRLAPRADDAGRLLRRRRDDDERCRRGGKSGRFHMSALYRMSRRSCRGRSSSSS